MLAQLHEHGQDWEEGDPRSTCGTCLGTHMQRACALMGCGFCQTEEAIWQMKRDARREEERKRLYSDLGQKE